MPLSRRVARFNRAFANHLAAPLFTRLPGFGTVHHRGRTSGREYSTPVKLFRNGEDYIIALPYGPGTDWVRNVLAAGGCEITSRGSRISVGTPRVVTDDGRSGVPPGARRVLSRLGATELLTLTPVPGQRHKIVPAEGKPSDVPTDQGPGQAG
jgi:deazaflavin-dependent oxidoreductase (nitroreductase family)